MISYSFLLRRLFFNVVFFSQKQPNKLNSLGSNTHPLQDPANSWNEAQTPGAEATWVPGQVMNILWKQNVAHPETNGSRSHYYRLDLAPIPNPTKNEDFTIEIGLIAATDVNDAQFSHKWTIPEGLEIEHGTLRVVYFTGYEGVAPDPTESGISNTYTACGDITIKAEGSTASTFAPSLVVGVVMILQALF